jgi:hypothetical protein
MLTIGKKEIRPEAGRQVRRWEMVVVRSSLILESFVLLRQGLTMQPRLASNSWSSCLSLLSAGITSMYHHTWLWKHFEGRRDRICW